MGLERAGMAGDFVSWGDVLHEGPTPGGLTPEEWRRVRVSYLASRGYGEEAAIARRYAEDDAILDNWREHEEVVFWFEHDLYDQLILIRHLDWMSRLSDRQATRWSLIQSSTYLGPLQPEPLAALFPTRVPVTEAQIQMGRRAWQAYCAPEPHELEQLAKRSNRRAAVSTRRAASSFRGLPFIQERTVSQRSAIARCTGRRRRNAAGCIRCLRPHGRTSVHG